MSITPMWRVDRDGSMFTDKKAAEEHDRMLELADGITGMLEANFKIDEQLAEEIGLLMSRNKDILAKAFKGKPEVLQEIHPESEVSANNTVDIREAIA
ncbi:YebG family protein [Endozoicomonas sp. SCSIO W0465]|uniref:YebG family protein n=1 Tax=Endozoicomonas sp. SCSIO W0465 TaxID=2918516 RepID=UPI002074DB9E|nr:YebG family protein [Endozoicomonas sp. SCSIO W0465]USE38885.1 YebG family protein [Endozoicomonas sp. SCSIO W0465]